jgi:acetyl esterase/lipase
MVRQGADRWNIDPHKIGIMGFSAGGHLAASAGTHFNNALIDNNEGTSLRPDFMILISPVISFTDRIGHIGSRDTLLGKSHSDEQIRFFSNESNVCSSTPPTLMIHAGDDKVSPVANSLEFYEALRRNSVPAELHIYPRGGHDISCHDSSLVPFEEWFGRCLYWMKSNGWL